MQQLTVEKASSIEDTPNQWIEVLKNYTTILDCEKWWENVNRRTWLELDAKLLKKTYFQHVASIAAQQYREKPVDKMMPKWVVDRAESAKGWNNNVISHKPSEDRKKQYLVESAKKAKLRADAKTATKIFAPAKIVVKEIPECPF